MNSISFKANLKVDDKLYKKMPAGTPEGYTDKLIKDYQVFLNHRVIQDITQGDTVELYKAPYRPGFALGIRFISDKLDKPLEGGVFTNKKIPNVNASSIIYQTMQFIIIKSGINQKFSESVPKAFIRAVKELYNKEN